MRIIELEYFTNKFEEQINFYENILGFDLQKINNNSFSIQVGWTKLIFTKSTKFHLYHYCFLIPSNKLDEGMEWLRARLELVDIEDGRVKQIFGTWNAESVYFYDGAGNIAEFIVRYDMKNETSGPFTLSDILCVNEIGLPTNDIEKINAQLEEELNTNFWKGNKHIFGTNGSNEGLFLLPNYENKQTWFPTKVAIEVFDIKAKILSGNDLFEIEYYNEVLKTKKINF